MAELDDANAGGFWWCPSCKMELVDENVTYEEHCDRCGQYVEWVDLPPDTAPDRLALRAAIYCAIDGYQLWNGKLNTADADIIIAAVESRLWPQETQV